MVSDVYNHIAEHHVQTKPQIDWPWGFVTCIKYSVTDYESNNKWLFNCDKKADENALISFEDS